MMKKFIVLLFTLVTYSVYCTETCSRTVIINGQKVLIDTSHSEKGEGLRFHLSKDPIAEKYLNKYQEGTRIRWTNAALGTLGTILLIAGAFNKSDSKKQRTFLITGSSLLIVNFLYAKTSENTNERYLERSIDEFNKRNQPKIYWDDDQKLKNDVSFVIHKTWSF